MPKAKATSSFSEFEDAPYVPRTAARKKIPVPKVPLRIMKFPNSPLLVRRPTLKDGEPKPKRRLAPIAHGPPKSKKKLASPYHRARKNSPEAEGGTGDTDEGVWSGADEKPVSHTSENGGLDKEIESEAESDGGIDAESAEESSDPDATIIKKPPGEAGRVGRGGYNLQTALGWSKADYRAAKVEIMIPVSRLKSLTYIYMEQRFVDRLVDKLEHSAASGLHQTHY